MSEFKKQFSKKIICPYCEGSKTLSYWPTCPEHFPETGECCWCNGTGKIKRNTEQYKDGWLAALKWINNISAKSPIVKQDTINNEIKRLENKDE